MKESAREQHRVAVLGLGVEILRVFGLFIIVQYLLVQWREWTTETGEGREEDFGGGGVTASCGWGSRSFDNVTASTVSTSHYCTAEKGIFTHLQHNTPNVSSEQVMLTKRGLCNNFFFSFFFCHVTVICVVIGCSHLAVAWAHVSA